MDHRTDISPSPARRARTSRVLARLTAVLVLTGSLLQPALQPPPAVAATSGSGVAVPVDWWTTALRLPEARGLATGRGVVVAVLAASIATDAGLTDSLLPPVDVTSAGETPVFGGPGYEAASAITGAPYGQPGRAVAPDAKVLPVVVHRALAPAEDAQVAAGVRAAVAAGAHVIDMALPAAGPWPAARQAVLDALSRGIPVVVPADLGALLTDGRPLDGLIVVSASDDRMALARSAAWDESVTVTVPRPYSDQSSSVSAGVASAVVAGTAALALEREPRLLPAALSARIVSSARAVGPPGFDPWFGAGLLDVASVVGGTARVTALPVDRLVGDLGADDQADGARALALGDGARGTLSPQGDVDWYRVRVEAGTWVHAYVGDPTAFGPFADPSIVPVLEVRDATGNRLAAASASVTVPVRSSGELLVRVSDRGGHAPDQEYALVVRATGERRFGATASRPGGGTHIVVGDVGTDGLPDVVGVWGPVLRVHRGAPGGTLTTEDRVVLPGAAGPDRPLALADLDGDARREIVVATDAGVQLVRSPGMQSSRIGPSAPVRTVLTGDLEGDGDIDIVSVGSSRTTALLNDGGARFTERTLVDAVLTNPVLLDLGSEGRLDLADARAVYRQGSDGTVRLQQSLPFAAPADALAVGEVTSDGRDDLVALVGGETVLLAQRADGSLEEPQVVSTGTTVLNMVVADVTGDGRADLVSSYGLAVQVRAQTAPGRFGEIEGSPLADRVPWYSSMPLQVADMDGDGAQDVVLCLANDELTVLRQDTLSTAPNPPGWVASTSPAPQSTGVPASAAVEIELLRPVEASSVSAATVSLYDGSTGRAVSATRTYDSSRRTVRVVPSSPLVDGRTYHVSVRGLRTSTGAVQDVPHRSWFTVGRPPSWFTPVSPDRVLDTRMTGPAPVRGSTVRLPLAGRVPADATAVVLNITASNPDGAGNVRVFPATSDGRLPLVSNLNVVRGVDQAGAVTVPLGVGQSVDLHLDGMSTHLVVDVAGYYGASGRTALAAVAPVRVLDTRDGTGGVPAAPVRAGRWVELQLTGRHGVPADAAAVVLNVTATGVTARTHVRVYPAPAPGADQTPPLVSSLNLEPGRDQANQVTVRVGDGGRIRLYTHSADLHLVADLTGWYSPTGELGYVPLSPTRIADTRTGLGLPGALLPATPAALLVAGRAGVPADAAAAVLTVTAAGPRGTTHVRAYPWTGTTVPTVSTLNLVAGRDEANATIARLGSGGAVGLYTHSATTDLVVDVSGYFTR